MPESAVQQQPILTEDQLNQISKEDLVLKWRELQAFTNNLQARLEQTQSEGQKKLVRLETQKSLEIAKLKNIILRKYAANNSADRESTNVKVDKNVKQESDQVLTFVDPSINAIIVQLKRELDEAREKKDELQMEIDSLKFNPESQICKRLMAKCKKLLKENEELGKMVSSGTVAQLEHDLAYHKEILNEACENEQNINSFLSEIDNEMEVMQTTILHLQERVTLAEAVDRTVKEPDSIVTGSENTKADDEKMSS